MSPFEHWLRENDLGTVGTFTANLAAIAEPRRLKRLYMNLAGGIAAELFAPEHFGHNAHRAAGVIEGILASRGHGVPHIPGGHSL